MNDPAAMSESATVEFDAYRAPKSHGQCVVRPGLDAAREVLETNRSVAAAYPERLSRLRHGARTRLLRDAARYTTAYRDVDANSIQPDRPMVLAGHQPTLFHPGVWFKNFALSKVARDTSSTAVNLVVDSDVAPPSSVRVPGRDRSSRRLGYSLVPYDRRGGGVPYEQALVEDRHTFDTFDANVSRRLGGLVGNPLIEPLWKHAREAINRCGYAGCALAQARHRLEADLGLATLEIPQSVVCRAESFGAFAMMILREIDLFHRCYNESTELYRLHHGIRSKSHPVPNLRRDGEWYEAPFWVYGNQSPQRRALWVRPVSGGSRLELSDRAQRSRLIDSPESDPSGESFASLESPELKIRSRALITTMFARLVLSDLFLHGIGGAKYDQLGDLIASRFWGIMPPSFMAISATVLLPGFEDFPISDLDQHRAALIRMQRDIHYQPERFIDEAKLPVDLIQQKQMLLSDVPPKGKRRHWHQRIVQINRTLSTGLSKYAARLADESRTLANRRRDSMVMHSREHSFCLYPLEYLTDAYGQMLKSS